MPNDYNEADVAFVQAMIEHHENAVIMAAKILKKGANPEIRALAFAIVEAQDKEIDKMLAWLKARDLKREFKKKSGSSGSHGM